MFVGHRIGHSTGGYNGPDEVTGAEGYTERSMVCSAKQVGLYIILKKSASCCEFNLKQWFEAGPDPLEGATSKFSQSKATIS